MMSHPTTNNPNTQDCDVTRRISVLKDACDPQKVLMLAAACDEDKKLHDKLLENFKNLTDTLAQAKAKGFAYPNIPVRRNDAKDGFAVGERVNLSYAMHQHALLEQVFQKLKMIKEQRADRIARDRLAKEAQQPLMLDSDGVAVGTAAPAQMGEADSVDYRNRQPYVFTPNAPPQPPRAEQRLFKLYFSGLAPGTTQQHFQSAFGDASGVKSITHPTSTSAHNKMYCFVDFFTFQDLQQAIYVCNQPGFQLNGLPCDPSGAGIGFSVDVPKNAHEALKQYATVYQQYKAELEEYNNKMAELEQQQQINNTNNNDNNTMSDSTTAAPTLPLPPTPQDQPPQQNTMSDDLTPATQQQQTSSSAATSIPITEQDDEWIAPSATATQYNLPPITYRGDIFSNPTRATSLDPTTTTVVILNMFTQADKDEVSKEELMDEIIYECNKYGTIQRVDIDLEKQMAMGGDGVVYYPAFITYNTVEEAYKAFLHIHRRTFDVRVLVAYLAKL